MQIDLASAAPDLIQSDIAIVGAGAAGITMARRLSAANRKIVLIESGGSDYEKETAALNAGTNVGQPYYDLEEARLRFFGGTTAIWGGRCAELAPIDFEKRPWVPDSGWPFGADEMGPWYDQARRLLDVDGDRSRLNGLDGMVLQELSSSYWSFDRRFDRFGFASSQQLIANPDVTLLLHATVREIIPTPNGKAVAQLDIRGPDGKRLRVKAKTYILAAGGLENPRLLLASNSICKNGIGNDRDLVGRYFMEHPHARGGRIVGAAAWRLLNAFKRRYVDDVEYSPLLTPTPELQRKEGILNSGITIAARPPEGGTASSIQRLYQHARHTIEPTSSGRRLWKTYRRVDRSIKQVTGPVTPWLKLKKGMDLAIVVRAEQAPNRESRVVLNGHADATGMRRINLDWRLQQIDIDTVSVVIDAFGRELSKQGLGEVEKAQWLRGAPTTWVTDSLVSTHPIGGYHHMGTTRMSNDPSRGVTDQWGRVHGISNLYIAGSSLFPTSGWANPTLTILALALRTSEKILQDN